VKVIILVRSMSVGGAERQIVYTAAGLRSRGIDVSIVSFYPGGELANELRHYCIHVQNVGKRGRWEVIGFARRLLRIIKTTEPDIVYSFLTIPNIVAIWMRLAHPETKVVWGIRASRVRYWEHSWLLGIAATVEARLSHRADAIVVNSDAGFADCLDRGMPKGRVRVIPNGIDTARFSFSQSSRDAVRLEMGIGDGVVVVGIVARLDPMKGHEMFLAAAASMKLACPHAKFVIVGGGPADYSGKLQGVAESLGLSQHVVWMGSRDDMPAVYSAMDIVVSASRYGEGFSNALGEAMSCERACVATEVGDSVRILGDAGVVVPAESAPALADAWLHLHRIGSEGRRELGARARSRITEIASMDAMIERTAQVLRAVRR
jgi:glycosyltransferase involved in cell wall biosynthesis